MRNFKRIAAVAMASGLLLAGFDSPGVALADRPGVAGIDVSGWQPNVDWQEQRRSGVEWAYVKATQGMNYTSPEFASQYNGSYDVGMIRGAYHFAEPAASSGAAQADYFVNHGGGWSADGQTLPGALDMESISGAPYCHGLSDAEMVDWVRSFATRYKARTSRDVVIYTNRTWWDTCTGNSTAFNQTNPLWFARYADTTGRLPGGWLYYTMWQYHGTDLDRSVFNGSMAQLRRFAVDPG